MPAHILLTTEFTGNQTALWHVPPCCPTESTWQGCAHKSCLNIWRHRAAASYVVRSDHTPRTAHTHTHTHTPLAELTCTLSSLILCGKAGWRHTSSSFNEVPRCKATMRVVNKPSNNYCKTRRFVTALTTALLNLGNIRQVCHQIRT